MKKIMMLLLVGAIAAPVFADAFFAPEFKEFCPPQYAHINTETNYKLSEKKYWANRKATFERRIAKCNTLTGQTQEACYNKVRELELSANATKNDFKSVQLQEQNVKNQLMQFHQVNVKHW